MVRTVSTILTTSSPNPHPDAADESFKSTDRWLIQGGGGNLGFDVGRGDCLVREDGHHPE